MCYKINFSLQKFQCIYNLILLMRVNRIFLDIYLKDWYSWDTKKIYNFYMET